MPLHRLTTITIGVPDVAPVAAYYEAFGLTPLGDGRFATRDGGEQLRLVTAPRRALLELGVGVDDADDLAAVAARLARLGITAAAGADTLTATDPGSGTRVVLRIAPPIRPAATAPPALNGPGQIARPDARAAAVLRDGPVQPRKLGHVVIGSTGYAATEQFFTDGLGFKVSDRIAGLGAFLRCSTDHHNLLVQPAPLTFLHHTSWQVDDVDEIGRGARALLEADPSRHVWGLGRHTIGSNYFWYLRDPAGNFTEYYADMDVILDDARWQPEVWDGPNALASWGPPPSPSFLAPDDLAELMA